MSSAIETELLESTKFQPSAKYKTRQDYLSAVLVSVDDMSDKEFSKLTEDTKAWINDAIDASNNKEDLPEFPDEDEAATDEAAEEQQDEDTGESDDGESGDAGGTEEGDAEEGEESGEATEESGEEGGDEEAETGEETGEDEAVAEEEVVEEQEEEVRPRRHVTKPPVKEPPKGTAKPAPKPVAKQLPATPAKALPKAKTEPKKTPGTNQTSPKANRPVLKRKGETDRYGLAIGSKVSLAVAMFEKGASQKDIKKELGGPQNNVIKTLIEQGHKVERYDGIIKVTHKDDIGTEKVAGKQIRRR